VIVVNFAILVAAIVLEGAGVNVAVVMFLPMVTAIVDVCVDIVAAAVVSDVAIAHAICDIDTAAITFSYITVVVDITVTIVAAIAAAIHDANVEGDGTANNDGSATAIVRAAAILDDIATISLCSVVYFPVRNGVSAT
jgi:hypothetical protein